MSHQVAAIALAPSAPAIPDVVVQARAMRGWLRDREAQANGDRRISAATIQAFKDAGFFRLVQPARWGGYDADYDLVSRVVEEIALGCASSAWVYGVLSLHHLFLASWPAEAQVEVWGDDPDVLISSSLAPRPVARVEGGYRLTGGWSFSSGCDHAGWAMVGGVVRGEPPVLLLVPMRDLTIVNDWHTLGLRGTGSKTLRFDDAFVPDARAVPLSVLYAGSRNGAMAPGDAFWDHAPQGLFGMYNFSCVLLGLAQRAIDLTTELLRTKVSRGIRLADVDSYRMKLAEAMAVVDIARFQMQGGCRDYVARLRAGHVYEPREVSQMARDVAVLVRQLRDTVLSLSEISGGWVYDTDPMQQIVRDILTGATHRSANWEAKVLPDAVLALSKEPAERAA